MARIRSIKPEFWRPQQESWAHARCCLYLVQEGDDGPVKIGIAAHPARRLSALQCGNHRILYLRAVFEGSAAFCQQVERFALSYFQGSAKTGEWVFADLDDVVRYLASFEGGDQ